MKKLIVLAASLAMVASFAMTAAAADWNFYGSSRVNTWRTSTEEIGGGGGTDVDNFAQGLQGNARIGASVKVSDELTGGFEYGTAVNVRKLYGEWNFGAGSFLVGQTYSPLNLFYSNQVVWGDYDLLPFGGVYSGREPMLRVKFGSFQIAAVEETNGGGEVDMPAIEAKYNWSTDNFGIALAGGYNSYETSVGGNTFDFNSYVLALGANASFGIGYVKGNIFTGENVSDLIWTDYVADSIAGTGLPEPAAAVAGGQVNDVEHFGFLLVAGAKINDMFSVEFGYAAANAEVDNALTENEVESYYGQATITMAPGVFVVPEIGRIDYNETGEDEVTYFGAKWQINF